MGAQADIFSLGVVAYQLLTGVHPFYADSLNTVIQRIVKDEVSAVREHRPECPESLEQLVERMLSKQPQARFERMLDVAVELAFAYEQAMHQGGGDNVAALKAIRGTPLFRDFSDQDIRELARASVIESKATGEVIIREREEDHAFFVLLEGVVNVSKEGNTIEDLGAGECFGEMGFLSRASRSATVSAKTPVRLLRVNKEIIDSVPESTQVKFYQTFVDVLIKRLSATTRNYLELMQI